ncbi:MAG TPA: DUF2330 domain-containing protein [Polyangiales bacterium]
MLVFSASPVQACGGAFGQGLDLQPTQTIAMGYRDGIESYVFRPSFCGPARSFGLVLPTPGPLHGQPELAALRLFEALSTLSAPEVVVKDVCTNGDGVGRGIDAGAGVADSGVSVLGGGRVDIFDWVSLAATSASGLTEWLDQNGFPYDTYATQVFADYVAAGYEFIAFKVAADELGSDAGAGGSLCGSFGPILLRFESPVPLVPVRMAASHVGAQHRSFSWSVYVASPSRMRAPSDEVTTQLYYAGQVTADQLASWPELSLIAQPGEYLTQLMLTFTGAEVSKDLEFSADTTNDGYRRIVTIYRDKYCEPDGGGCALAPPHQAPPLVAVLLLAILLARLLLRMRTARRALARARTVNENSTAGTRDPVRRG